MSLKYIYKHSSTEATTGYFSCEPDPALDIEQGLKILAKSPLDDFLHQYILRKLMSMTYEDITNRLTSLINEQGPIAQVLTSLLLECAMLRPSLAKLGDMFSDEDYTKALSYTPLPHLAWQCLEQKDLQRAWSKVFADNILRHHKLPHPEELSEDGLSPLYSSAPKLKHIDIKNIFSLHQAKEGSTWSRPPAQQTAQQALTILVENDILDGMEMRHEASLSPIALLRNWKVRLSVEQGRHSFNVEGQGTTYGRGLSLADARASYAMEMIERASAYASVKDDQVLGLTRPTPLFKASYPDLVKQQTPALDPNQLPLEVPYTDAKLYWMEAEEAYTKQTILVPIQAVYLFCNLDEPSIFMNPGSTGLATGNTLAEAKLAALTEIIERDAEATMPYTRNHCFILRSKDERMQALLDDYAARGINVQFLDLTTEFGIPCYQAFVMDTRGEVIRATGANLNGARAAISALTEVPYPYPHGPTSGPALAGLEERFLEDLPDYTLKSPTQNLALLEDVLIQHGHRPLYVEITQEGLEFPVLRAIVPGLELGAEFDDFSRISTRLYGNYLRLFTE